MKRKLVVAAPRGTAKSTLVAEVFVLWCICFKVVDFILIISDTEDQAKMRLEMIKAELEGNERLREVFGNLVGSNLWGALELETSTGVRVMVRGTGQKIRGLKHGKIRPQLVVVDDAENEENVETEEQRKKLKRWFHSSLLPGMDPDGFIAVIGTVLHEDSLLMDLLNSPSWRSRKYALIQDGKPLWPEVYPMEEIERLREEYISHGELDLFYREYMNEIIASDSAVFQRKMFTYITKKELVEKAEASPLRTFLTIDPAYKTQNHSDYSAFCISHTDSTNKLYVEEVIRARLDLPQLLDLWFLLHQKYEFNAIGVQSVDWSRLLEGVVKEEMRRRNVYFKVTPLQTYGKAKGLSSKEARIERLAPRYASGQIVHVQGGKGIDQLEAELLAFPRSKYDDCMDALSQIIDLVFPAPTVRKSSWPSFMLEPKVDPTSGYG